LLPSGGRGTDREKDEDEFEFAMPPDLALEGSDIDLELADGRGISWFIAINVGSERPTPEVILRGEDPAAEGGLGTILRLDIVGLLTPRFDIEGAALPRATGLAVLRAVG
jgi:hypothetical protein